MQANIPIMVDNLFYKKYYSLVTQRHLDRVTSRSRLNAVKPILLQLFPVDIQKVIIHQRA